MIFIRTSYLEMFENPREICWVVFFDSVCIFFSGLTFFKRKYLSKIDLSRVDYDLQYTSHTIIVLYYIFFCQCQLLTSVDGSCCCVNQVASILSSSSTSMYATIYQFNHLLQISTMAVMLMITDYGSIGIHNVSD